MELNSLKISGQWSVVSGQWLRLTTVTCLLLLTFIAGCKKEEAAPTQAAPVKQVAKPVQAAVTTVKKEEYAYDAAGKRDPFKPFIELEKKGAPAKVPLSPLQAYDVNELRLVGIILLPGKRVAMIEDPAGKGYNVTVGVLIGKNDGKVVEILKDEVIVEEKLVDETGQPKTRKVSITIPKEKEGEGK
ncbi:MAG: pilus assembly protein PilP [Deltaproteobacteria bacterium]|nr:pilus assembly protein PilP [Deltaproteobacteria bacterium]